MNYLEIGHGTTYNQVKLRVAWYEESVNTDKNTSVIVIDHLEVNSNYVADHFISGTLSVNGNTKTLPPGTTMKAWCADSNSWYTFDQFVGTAWSPWKVTVTHDSNGNAAVPITFSGNVNPSGQSNSLTGSSLVNLTKIGGANMTGASGVVEFPTSGNWVDYVIRVYWTQEYTAGSTSSTVTITKCTIQASKTVSGTWWMDGYITINGVDAIYCWYSGSSSHPSFGINTTDEIELPSMTGSVTVDQPNGAAMDVDITVRHNKQSSWGFYFWNSSYSNYSFNINDKTKSISLDAIQCGLAYIGGDKYLPYICIDGAYVQCQPYIGAADGSSWILLS